MKQRYSSLKLTVYGLLFLLLFFGLLQIVLQSRGKVFLLEALGALGLALLIFAGSATYHRGLGEKLFFAFFLFFIANLLLLRSLTGSLYVVLLLFSFLGFIMSFPRRRRVRAQREVEEEPHSMVFDSTEESSVKADAVKPKVESAVVKKESKEAKTENKELKAETKTASPVKASSVMYNPGKYLASTRGNVYHEAKCDWAKKVGKTHRLWFNTKKEAEEKGYAPHSCVASQNA